MKVFMKNLKLVLVTLFLMIFSSAYAQFPPTLAKMPDIAELRNASVAADGAFQKEWSSTNAQSKVTEVFYQIELGSRSHPIFKSQVQVIDRINADQEFTGLNRAAIAFQISLKSVDFGCYLSVSANGIEMSRCTEVSIAIDPKDATKRTVTMVKSGRLITDFVRKNAILNGAIPVSIVQEPSTLSRLVELAKAARDARSAYLRERRSMSGSAVK